MTLFVVYDGARLVSRTRDEVLAERLRAACDGRIERIERQPTAGELLAGEQRVAA